MLPQTIARFRSSGDSTTADLLQHCILKEEIEHCAAGVRWLCHLYGILHVDSADCHRQQGEQCISSCNVQAGGDINYSHAGAMTAGTCQEGKSGQAVSSIYPRVETWFHELVRHNFNGSLKPPFNAAARQMAGFTKAWYQPLATCNDEP